MKKEKIHVMFDADLVSILRGLATVEDRPLSRTVTFYLKEGLKAHGHPTTLEEENTVEAKDYDVISGRRKLDSTQDEPPPPDEEPPQDIVWWRQGGMER